METTTNTCITSPCHFYTNVHHGSKQNWLSAYILHFLHSGLKEGELGALVNLNLSPWILTQLKGHFDWDFDQGFARFLGLGSCVGLNPKRWENYHQSQQESLMYLVSWKKSIFTSKYPHVHQPPTTLVRGRLNFPVRTGYYTWSPNHKAS